MNIDFFHWMVYYLKELEMNVIAIAFQASFVDTADLFRRSQFAYMLDNQIDTEDEQEVVDAVIDKKIDDI